MNKYATYVIAFRGLSAGVHTYSWDIDGTFFEVDNYCDVREASVTVDLNLTKTERHMQLDFAADGSIVLPCDRCLEPLSMKVKATRTMVIRQSEGTESEDDDMVFLSSSDYEFSVASWIRETILLSLPMRNTHKDGDCDEQVISKLRELSDKGGSTPFSETKI